MPESDPNYPHAEVTLLQHAIGMAINAWSNFERELYSLYLVMHGPYRGQPVTTNDPTVVFHAIINIDVKLDIITALLENNLGETSPFTERWNKIFKKKINKKKKIRNKIVHYELIVHHDRSNKNNEYTVFLNEPISDHRVVSKHGFGTSAGGALFTADVLKHMAEFFALTKLVNDFTTEIVADGFAPQKPSPDKSQSEGQG